MAGGQSAFPYRNVNNNEVKANPSTINIYQQINNDITASKYIHRDSLHNIYN